MRWSSYILQQICTDTTSYRRGAVVGKLCSGRCRLLLPLHHRVTLLLPSLPSATGCLGVRGADHFTAAAEATRLLWRRMVSCAASAVVA